MCRQRKATLHPLAGLCPLHLCCVQRPASGSKDRTALQNKQEQQNTHDAPPHLLPVQYERARRTVFPLKVLHVSSPRHHVHIENPAFSRNLRQNSWDLTQSRLRLIPPAFMLLESFVLPRTKLRRPGSLGSEGIPARRFVCPQ